MTILSTNLNFWNISRRPTTMQDSGWQISWFSNKFGRYFCQPTNNGWQKSADFSTPNYQFLSSDTVDWQYRRIFVYHLSSFIGFSNL